jgi:hypothetical protein
MAKMSSVIQCEKTPSIAISPAPHESPLSYLHLHIVEFFVKTHTHKNQKKNRAFIDVQIFWKLFRHSVWPVALQLIVLPFSVVAGLYNYERIWPYATAPSDVI